MRRRALLLIALMVAALVVASGVAWAASISCPNRSGNLCVGTSKSDTMTGRNRADDMRGKEGADILRARGGKDTLSGGKGKDVLKGGDADDIYDFSNNDWGNDTIVDTADSDTDPITGNFMQFGFPDQLTTRITVNLTSSANSPEVSNGTFTGTVNWSNNAIDGVYVDSITDDTIIGNASANQLTAKGGSDSDDTINGGPGNDLLNVSDFEGGDTVTCGDGFDKVFYDPDPPSPPGDTLTDPNACEIKSPF